MAAPERASSPPTSDGRPDGASQREPDGPPRSVAGAAVPAGSAEGAPAPGPRLLDRPEMALGLAFWVVSGVTAAACGTFAHWWPYAVPVAAFVAAWPRIRRARAAPTVLDWAPFPLVLVTYDMLHAVAPRSWAGTIDPFLRSADRALLGGDAAALLAPSASPALTAFFGVCYASYYVAPVAVGAWWWASRRRTAFRELMVGVAGALFVGYLGYLFLPAVGPHVHIAPADVGPALEGDFMGAWIRARYEVHDGHAPRDAFPSLHTANAVTLLLMAWRHDRRAFAALLVPMTGLVGATLYLRFHYVVDVAAGALLALAWQPAALALVRREAGKADAPPRPATG